MNIELKLKSDLEFDKFALLYKPIFNVQTNKVVAAEVNVAYQTKYGEQLLLNEFITSMESNDMISKIDLWAFDKICRLQQERIRSGQVTIPLILDISSLTMCNPYSIYDIVLIFKKYNIPSHCVELALSASNQSLSAYGMSKSISFLQNEGIRVTLNHFGLGTSSLTLFTDISFDTIILSQAMLTRGLISERNDIILNHALSLCRELKISVVFSGISSLNELQYIKKFGDNLAGGSLFGEKLKQEELYLLL